VNRLLAAEALVFSFPVWNMGFPAILKGFIDKVFLPGVSFTLSEDGSYNPCLHNIKRSWRCLHLWRLAVADDDDGRSSAPLLDALHASDLRAGRALRLSRPLRHESFEARAPRGLHEKDRGAVFELVNETIEDADWATSFCFLKFLSFDRAPMFCQLRPDEIHERAHARRAAKIRMG
jgi:Flavodoxin-like fold